MTRYTPEFLASLKRRYEETDQPMRPLALEFGIGISTLSAIVEREGWVKRSQRKRGQIEAPLLSEAQALLASLPGRGAEPAGIPIVEPSVTPFPTLPLAGGGSPLLAPPVSHQNLTAAQRLEILLEMEIAAEETARAELGDLPRLRSEADACTRRLATLTQVLQTLHKIREATPTTNLCPRCANEAPEMDIDELRLRLARRIEAFMESRTDEEFEQWEAETQAMRAAERSAESEQDE